MGLVVSCAAYLGALALLISNRQEFDGYVFELLSIMLVAFFLEDLAGAVATDMNGFARTVAHLCQVVALYFFYKAFVEVGLTKPYSVLLRRQQHSAEALRQSEERYRLELEQKVEQRTAELSETIDELHREIADRKQAQESLHEVERQLQGHQAELAHVARLSMMGEMAANLAHELNQPLHAVKNYARGCVRRLSKRPEKDEEVVAALEQISEEAERAAAIIRRVKGFVQKREPQVVPVLVNDLVEEVVLLSKSELEQRHARVVLELAENLPTVLGDPIQIEQVLMNLVRNSLEAMDDSPNEDRLVVIASCREGDDRVRVEVRDCGKGIGPDDLERVFEPFFTTKPEGMGMGLAISRSIIQSHGGRLWASPGPARGCTFHFTLPSGTKGSDDDR
jgi:two-component system sensor histidine kinase TtrS